jgi:hypothetical protein
MASGRGVPKARGGFVYGPGTSTSDSIHAMLSTGEFVTRAKVAQLYRRELDYLNRYGKWPAFAGGGFVGRSNTSPTINVSTPALDLSGIEAAVANRGPVQVSVNLNAQQVGRAVEPVVSAIQGGTVHRRSW